MATSRSVVLAAGAVAGVGPQGVYKGLRIAETAGAVARVRIWDNTSAAGTILDEVRLLANASDWRDEEGVMVNIGIFVEIVAGTVEGSLRIG